ncbi:transcription-repair coupling factor [Fervidicella metallireducens AeB]|uniref:Transcription-repair-coupling factor n=1 Tax=Fervidicella metallireducens AeB TaxID=1403537 RepID=A0A017RTA2_9CLOT|nr:transcription-repair coupling factor [Fervidicella metallireducens]EYE87897.1 transcription-repair coupling factor [Fervidicella metallireducens AeB]
MKFKGLNILFKECEEYKTILAALKNNRTPCQVHGLSESQKAYVSYCLSDDFPNQTIIFTHNDIEARKIYEDLRVFTENCYYFPIKEMVLNVDVTSGDIKTQRLSVIKKILEGDKVIVVTSIDALFYKMPPKDTLKNSAIKLKREEILDVSLLAEKLVDLGYERVDVIEGKGQFARRGGIIDIYSPIDNEPYRVEFFGDEIDTIRTFDIETQRSLNPVEEIVIYPAREVVISKEIVSGIVERIDNDLKARQKLYSKKNKEMAQKLELRVKENIEKLQNLRYFDGMDSYIPYIYKNTESFIDYFNNPLVILDESARISQRIRTASEEFQETYKTMLEKGELLPLQGEYMFSTDYMMDNLKSYKIIAMNMLPRVVEEVRANSLINFNAISINPISGNIDYLLEEIKIRANRGYRVLILAGAASRAERLVKSLAKEGFNCSYKEIIDDIRPGSIVVSSGSLSRGMEFPDIKISIISDKEIYKEKREKKKTFTKKSRKIESFTDIKVGDFVVHVNHGIGVFKGIKELHIEGIKKDYLVLQYHGGDTLYVPVEQLDMVQKYIGSDEVQPKLYKLGGSDWTKAKKKVKESLKEMAEDLVELYAYRAALKGHAFSKDTVWQKQFEEEFPYEETPDQLTAIEEIKKDMEQPRPMDRLLCGDVGYGKTEVAMRAAFKAVMDGKQVAVLVPTTILAEQHYNNFRQRFSDFPVNIDMISRFRSKEQQKKAIKELAAGNIDIIIGTHRLLQKDIKYKDLGLLIVDEEQRFGVSHKEKIKAFKKNIDVLTLTATPIPRTLHMSLIGVRDMSVIETPPEERFPVQTYVMEYNEGIIRDSIIRELSRGGQVFFVYNRVETIKDMQIALSRLVPEAKVVVAHGQMNESELEDVILGFIAGEGDVLLCTTIIETGIDIPNVNTLIVYDADRMGLSQLYQLRGRVGRSNRLAYAYFTYRKDKVLTEVAEKRLKAIKEFTEFGSGFKIAMRDLEIRGAGNLLGTQQHGHMAAVGYDLYCRLLEEAVRELKGEIKEEYIETTIELTVNAYIPDSYIQDEMLKIEIYKKIAAIENVEDKMDIEEEVIDRFGDIPKPVENLISIAYTKAIAKKLKILNIKQNANEILLQFKNGEYISVETLRAINEKIDGVTAGYASTTQPLIRIKLGKDRNKEALKTLKDILEFIGRLHKK